MKSPLEIVLLPHFVRGSRQLLLYMTDTFAGGISRFFALSEVRALYFSDFPAATVCNLNVFRKEVVEKNPLIGMIVNGLFPSVGSEDEPGLTAELLRNDTELQQQFEALDLKEIIDSNKQPVCIYLQSCLFLHTDRP